MYEIDGRTCRLRSGGPSGSGIKVAEEGGEEMPLTSYLKQAANVAVSLSKPPGQKAKKASFNTPGSTVDCDIDDNTRTHSMEVACMEAEIRRQQAQNSMPVKGSRTMLNPMVFQGLR
jgi:hypothetical protein